MFCSMSMPPRQRFAPIRPLGQALTAVVQGAMIPNANVSRCLSVDVAVFSRRSFRICLAIQCPARCRCQGFTLMPTTSPPCDDALVQPVQVISSCTQELAAVRQIHNSERIVGKQVIHVVSSRSFPCLRGKRRPVPRRSSDLPGCRRQKAPRSLLDLQIRASALRRLFLGGELILSPPRRSSHVAVIAAGMSSFTFFIHGHEHLFPKERVVGKGMSFSTFQKLSFFSFHHVSCRNFLPSFSSIFASVFSSISVFMADIRRRRHGERSAGDHQRDYSIHFSLFCSFSLFSFLR